MAVQTIFQKLEMFDTRVQLSKSQIERVLIGHNKGGKVEKSLNVEPLNSPFIGSNGLFSSLNDLLKWLLYNMEKGSTDLNFLLPLILEPRRIMNITTQSEICLGWEYMFLEKSRNFRYYSANSKFAGYSAFIGFTNETKTGVILLANSEVDIEQAGIRVLQLLN